MGKILTMMEEKVCQEEETRTKVKEGERHFLRYVSGEWQVIWSDLDTKTNWKGKLVRSGRVLNVSIYSDFTVDIVD